jgi:hypothetical protein
MGASRGARSGADAHAVKQRWLDRAFRHAGIDGARWHPGAGVDVNRQTIERVYRYYAELYLKDRFLEWTGMAALVGPAFYAGFKDLGVVPDAVRRAVGFLVGRASRRIARWAAGDLGFYETLFLTMQRKIFEDQAVMHEAYLGGGIDALAELRDVAIVDDATFEAWRSIDSAKRGSGGGLDDGNRQLLFREQHDIIDRFYLRMFEHPPLGRVFTYLLTLAGAPSLPGAKSFAEVFPLSLRLPVAERATLALATPLAAGNIALFTNRWALIESNTLPDYLRLIHERPAEADALIATPIAERVDRFRLLARAGLLVRGLLTHWRLRLVRGVGPRPSMRPVPPFLPLAPVTIDLRRPPDRASLPADGDTRVWEAPSRQPFETRVELPGDRELMASTVRAVLFASVHGRLPDRLVLTLPTMDLVSAWAALKRLSPAWGIPESEIEDWRGRAELRAKGEGDYQYRAYSTQVFTAAPIGVVKLQMQLAQHLGEGAFVMTALFSWNEL